MLSKNTTRGARHGQPELNAARLRNAQQVEERDGGRGGGRVWEGGREKALRLEEQRKPYALRTKLMIYEII